MLRFVTFNATEEKQESKEYHTGIAQVGPMKTSRKFCAHSSFASNYWTYEPLAFCAWLCLTMLDWSWWWLEHFSFQENGLNEQPKAFSTVPYSESMVDRFRILWGHAPSCHLGKEQLCWVLLSESTDCCLNFAMRYSAGSNGGISSQFKLCKRAKEVKPTNIDQILIMLAHVDAKNNPHPRLCSKLVSVA